MYGTIKVKNSLIGPPRSTAPSLAPTSSDINYIVCIKQLEYYEYSNIVGEVKPSWLFNTHGQQ